MSRIPPRPRSLALPLLLLLAAGAARSQDAQPAPPREERAAAWSWSGFGTLSTYRHDAGGVRVRPDSLVARAAEPGEWRWDGDSRLGLQARWRADERLEFVTQVEASDEDERRWSPRLAWAFVAWEAMPGLSLRLGRQVLPTLRHSETRNIGFA